MTDTPPRKLPPMSALEFAIESTFRHFFFGVRLALLWTIVMAPLLAAAYVLALRDGLPDPATLPAAAMAVLIALAVVALAAVFSATVNWHRRLVLKETPRRLGWVRLNGVVWKYTACFLFMVLVLAVFAAAGAAIMIYGVPALEPQARDMARPIGIAAVVLLGLSGLFTWYRLSSWLPAVATGDSDYTLRTAWRATRRNRIRYLGFTFWLLFTLAIAGAAGAGAFFAQQALGNPYATMAAFAFIGLLGWLTLFLFMSIAAGHYVYFAGKLPEAKDG